MNRILIIDDDVELANLFQDYLQREGFSVDLAMDGDKGLTLALSGNFDLIVLDIMLPDVQGDELLACIRYKSNLPILMFSAKGDDMDRITGLEAGADDYVAKPCSPRELTARIRAILRRGELVPSLDYSSNPIQVNALSIWMGRRRAYWHNRALDLTSAEFDLLSLLALHAGHVVSKQELSKKALSRPLTRFDRSIDVHMSSIRQKLGTQLDGTSYIQTVRGKGYQLIKA